MIFDLKGFLYHNAEKERKMVHMLTKRLYTARKQIPKLHGKLETMLNDRKLAIVDLPSIREKLETQARLVGGKIHTNFIRVYSYFSNYTFVF